MASGEFTMVEELTVPLNSLNAPAIIATGPRVNKKKMTKMT